MGYKPFAVWVVCFGSYEIWYNTVHFEILNIGETKKQSQIGIEYRLCQKKKIYNFLLLIAEKVNKAQQQSSGGQNTMFLCVRRFLNGIIPLSGVKVMVHWVKSGKNKVGHFCHYYERHGSNPIGETHSDLR